MTDGWLYDWWDWMTRAKANALHGKQLGARIPGDGAGWWCNRLYTILGVFE